MNKSSLLLVLLTCSSVVSAAKSVDGMYVFASGGQTNYSDMTSGSDIAQAESRLLTSVFAQFSIENPGVDLPQYSADLSEDDRSTSVSFGLGYAFSQYIAVETSYQYLGSVKLSGTVNEAGSLVGAYSATGITTGFDLRTVLRAPIGGGVELLVNWGALLWSRETRTLYEFDNRSNASMSKERGFEVVFGGGLQYVTDGNLGASLVWERYNINQENADVVKATLIFDFDIPQ